MEGVRLRADVPSLAVKRPEVRPLTTVVIMAAALLAFGPTLAGIVRGAVLIPLSLCIPVLLVRKFMVLREGHRSGR